MREATSKRNELLAREEAARAAAGDAANAIKEAQVCRHAPNLTTTRLHSLVIVGECQYVRIKFNQLWYPRARKCTARVAVQHVIVNTDCRCIDAPFGDVRSNACPRSLGSYKPSPSNKPTISPLWDAWQ